jgi:hypothetical protein
MIHYYNISWIYLKGCSILISVYISLLAFNFFYPIETSENIIDKIPEIPYHKRYPLVKQDGEISDEKAKEFKNNVIFEHTPNGYIFMKYNSDENAFEFYSDRREVPYRYLETAGRKYCKQFHCSSLFVVMEDEIKNSKDKQLEIDKKEIEKEVKNEIYASFKKYNRKTSKMNLVKEKINKYKYVGQLNEFKLLKEEVSDAKKNMTFKNFKNLKSI